MIRIYHFSLWVNCAILTTEKLTIEKERGGRRMYDICIIGAGPAGISSAIYAVSRGLKTIVLEQKAVGGLLGGVSTVTHYAGIIEEETGETFAARLKAQAEGAGVEIVMEQVKKAKLTGQVKIIETDQGSYEAKAVIIAAGTRPRRLGIEGEEEFQGRGTGMNPAKDGARYVGKDIFVVGGADGAVKEALYLAKSQKSYYHSFRRHPGGDSGIYK